MNKYQVMYVCWCVDIQRPGPGSIHPTRESNNEQVTDERGERLCQPAQAMEHLWLHFWLHKCGCICNSSSIHYRAGHEVCNHVGNELVTIMV
jgi:hypothetical protein